VTHDVIFVGAVPDWLRVQYEAEFALHMLPSGDPADLPAEVMARAGALIAGAPVSHALMDVLPKLGLIAVPGAGTDRVDIPYAASRGVAVTNAPGTTDGCVADMAFALLLAVARHVVAGDAHARSGAWEREDYPLVPRLYGRRMGIVGLGRIGMEIAKRAAGFDMPVAYHNRRPRDDVPFAYHDSPRALAEAVDILMLAAPGGAGTRHMIDAAVLAALGPKGLVVNIGRGPVIDEAALIEALESGAIAGAGLDVLENEPVVPSRLAALSNVVLTPHRGGGTFETWQEVCDMVRANLHAHFRGEPLISPVQP
jgi:lactate dehydrogenase-like 2-hydroxyacid dehydrogenase